jgi:hypothetical protein
MPEGEAHQSTGAYRSTSHPLIRRAPRATFSPWEKDIPPLSDHLRTYASRSLFAGTCGPISLVFHVPLRSVTQARAA